MPENKLTKNELKALINSKILSMLGFAARAGKLETGVDRICDEIRRNGMPSDDINGYSTRGIVLVASDASANTKKRIFNACKYYRVEMIEISLTQDEIASRIGKASAASVATFDKGFADGIRKAIDLKYPNASSNI